MVEFRAPWSGFLKVASGIISLILLAVFWFAAPLSTLDESTPFLLFLYVFPVAFLSLTALFIVRRYEISDDEVEIVRVIGRARYPISSIEKIEHDPEATAMSIRMMGNGGLYSFSGLFRNQKLGNYRAYVTDKANSVILYRSTGIPIVISPGEPQRFIDELQQRI